MRIIKFRAWDTIKKEMLHQKHFMNGDNYDRANWLEIIVDQLEEVSIMQFTGSFDSNGKEIFEGDICILTLNDDEAIKNDAQHMINYGKPSKVRFDEKEGRFYFADFIPMYWSGHRRISVIGNEYENPELLENAPKIL